MALPTLSEVQKSGAKRYKFRRRNKVRYWMDFGMHEGLPSDRLFYLAGDGHHGDVVLVAEGYGLREAYGNGSISVRPDQLVGHEHKE